jgi:serine/threonine-protein kinase
MLAGEPAFSAGTAIQILEAISAAEPDWGALPASLQPTIRKLLRWCLERDRKHRLRDIGEARIVIDMRAAYSSRAATVRDGDLRRQRTNGSGSANLSGPGAHIHVL